MKTRQGFTVAELLLAVGVLAIGTGCQIGYKIDAPLLVNQRGGENSNNQGRSGSQTRSTNAEQQVADTTAEQTQTENEATADMPSAIDETKQIGAKQGQGVTTTKAQGRDETDAAATDIEQSPTGQHGGDAAAIGATPTAKVEIPAAPEPALEPPATAVEN